MLFENREVGDRLEHRLKQRLMREPGTHQLSRRNDCSGQTEFHVSRTGPSSYDLFLRERERAWLNTRSGNIEARHLLGRAVTINPELAAAHAFIGFTQVNDYVNGWAEVPERSLQIGLENARRAVQMDEAEPQGHYALAVALFFHRETDRALAEARRSVALAPNFAQGHHTIARMLTFSGDAAGAINTIDAYMQLDPLYPDMALYFLAEAQFALGQFEEAVTVLKQRHGRNPNSATSYALLASCYGHLGRIAESQAAWAEVMRIAPDFSIERQRRTLPFDYAVLRFATPCSQAAVPELPATDA